MIINNEADIKKIASLNDRREVRNFIRFRRLWPSYKHVMIDRPRWATYLGFTSREIANMSAAYRASLLRLWS